MVPCMALTVEMVTVDRAHPGTLAGFRTGAPGDRRRLDLPAAPSEDRRAEVGPGATVVDGQARPGFARTVPADPEGTVFCVGAPG